MTLSAVIATHNRREILRKALVAYLNQIPSTPPLEVLVVDDGSSDGTAEMVAGLKDLGRMSIRYFRQEKRGAAAARNIGLREAVGEIILFTDDDILPADNLVAEHSLWHQKYPEPSVAVLGYMTWSPEVHPTPFMRWYGREGVVSDLRALEGQKELSCKYFYTGNISLKTEFLRENGPFDEDFKTYGWEDFELGYRLMKKGLRLKYNPQAIGYHYQHVKFEDACRRARRVVATRRILSQKEAGKYLAEWERRRDRELGRRVVMWFARCFSPL
jgi:glycosyltransferase involved in cell wall biosynthesis